MIVLEMLPDTLRRYPELAIFLTVGAGFWIGSVKFGSISLGAVIDALFAGLVIGQSVRVGQGRIVGIGTTIRF